VPGASGVLKFLHTCHNLKATKRTGWVERGIQGAESISDHMHRMSIMAMLVDDPLLDKSRCVKIAIVHVMASPSPYALLFCHGKGEATGKKRKKKIFFHL